MLRPVASHMTRRRPADKIQNVTVLVLWPVAGGGSSAGTAPRGCRPRTAASAEELTHRISRETARKGLALVRRSTPRSGVASVRPAVHDHGGPQSDADAGGRVAAVVEPLRRFAGPPGVVQMRSAVHPAIPGWSAALLQLYGRLRY